MGTFMDTAVCLCRVDADLNQNNDFLQTVDDDSRSADGSDRRDSSSPASSDFVVPSLARTSVEIGTGAKQQELGQPSGVTDEDDDGDAEELELDSFISGIGLNK